MSGCSLSKVRFAAMATASLIVRTVRRGEEAEEEKEEEEGQDFSTFRVLFFFFFPLKNDFSSVIGKRVQRLDHPALVQQLSYCSTQLDYQGVHQAHHHHTHTGWRKMDRDSPFADPDRPNRTPPPPSSSLKASIFEHSRIVHPSTSVYRSTSRPRQDDIREESYHESVQLSAASLPGGSSSRHPVVESSARFEIMMTERMEKSKSPRISFPTKSSVSSLAILATRPDRLLAARADRADVARIPRTLVPEHPP